MYEVVITKENFNREVLQYKDTPVLIDFWAMWCGPCMALGPIIEQIADEYKGKLKVGKVNVDDQPELASAFSVESIPMLAVVKDGKLVNKSVGLQPKEAILALVGLE
ncbi:thioredoxin [Ruminococcus flavefaciens]|uniref:Thioredoxin n=1 Tax=Ruminococcus flavefaciens TaxID=1265 RepID=A0A1H6IQ40_RUMFL|nr:thioredoxin [Ruminococcus flavefaciens]SEH51273.1 thioredoxin [Ruminococcus flavefaciens]